MLVAGKMRLMGLPLVVAPALPAAATVQAVDGVNELTAPAHVMVTPVTVVAAVPVLVTVASLAAPTTLQVNVVVDPAARLSAATKFSEVTWTWAELDAEPKMPNTKPPIATAAIRVTAMISTVAMIGEMAFLAWYFPYGIFIGELSDLYLVYEAWELLVWFSDTWPIIYCGSGERYHLMSRLTDGIRKANERDRLFIMSLSLSFLDKVLAPLYATFLCLDFLDVYSTLLAMKSSFDFHELNPIASALFSLHFSGFLIAVAFKYLPAIPLFYLVYVRDPSGQHPFEIRLVRFVGLVSLIAADGLLGYIVAWNNIPILLSFVGH